MTMKNFDHIEFEPFIDGVGFSDRLRFESVDEFKKYLESHECRKEYSCVYEYRKTGGWSSCILTRYQF